MYCVTTTQGIEPVLCSNYKWHATFKNCEVLNCPPVTDIIMYINYNSMKNEKNYLI